MLPVTGGRGTWSSHGDEDAGAGPLAHGKPARERPFPNSGQTAPLAGSGAANIGGKREHQRQTAAISRPLKAAAADGPAD